MFIKKFRQILYLIINFVCVLNITNNGMFIYHIIIFGVGMMNLKNIRKRHDEYHKYFVFNNLS